MTWFSTSVDGLKRALDEARKIPALLDLSKSMEDNKGRALSEKANVESLMCLVPVRPQYPDLSIIIHLC
jgi:hypothetical protein